MTPSLSLLESQRWVLDSSDSYSQVGKERLLNQVWVLGRGDCWARRTQGS